MNPTIHIIGYDYYGPLGHVDLNNTRTIFGSPHDIFPNIYSGSPADYPAEVDPRGIVFCKHRDYPAPSGHEFVAILDALQTRWPDRPCYAAGPDEMIVFRAKQMH